MVLASDRVPCRGLRRLRPGNPPPTRCSSAPPRVNCHSRLSIPRWQRRDSARNQSALRRRRAADTLRRVSGSSSRPRRSRPRRATRFGAADGWRAVVRRCPPANVAADFQVGLISVVTGAGARWRNVDSAYYTVASPGDWRRRPGMRVVIVIGLLAVTTRPAAAQTASVRLPASPTRGVAKLPPWRY